MVLYIDKENLISLVRSEDKAGFAEYAALVRKNLDLHYNFPKEEIRGNEYLSFWFSQLGSGVGGVHEFCPPKNIVPERPMKSNFYNSLDADGRSALFFLNDDGKCAAAENKCCVMVAKVGDELSKLKEIFRPDEQGEVLAYQITDWGNFLPHLPLSDIIICDNHYFKDKDVYEANNNEIIRFLSAIPQNSPVNVVIIVKQGEVDRYIDLATEQAKIKNIVKKASGSIRSTVTIFTTYATHDRTLITNYFRVKQGSSFHIKHNNIKHDVSAEVKCHAIRRHFEFSKSLLAEYQTIALNPCQCFGDKVSNFLRFE